MPKRMCESCKRHVANGQIRLPTLKRDMWLCNSCYLSAYTRFIRSRLVDARGGLIVNVHEDIWFILDKPDRRSNWCIMSYRRFSEDGTIIEKRKILQDVGKHLQPAKDAFVNYVHMPEHQIKIIQQRQIEKARLNV